MAGSRAAVHRHRHRAALLLLAQLGQNRIPHHRRRYLAVPGARRGAGGDSAGQAWLEAFVRFDFRVADVGCPALRDVRSVRQSVRAAGHRFVQRSAGPLPADLRFRGAIHGFQAS